MATVDLTLEQILGAVEQLSAADKRRLQRELARRESPDQAPLSAKRMSRLKARKMSKLLLKANAGALTSVEDNELNALVDEFESLTLASAEAMANGRSVTHRRGGARRSTKR